MMTQSFPPDPYHVGPYQILRELGRGGQGTVYLAQDARLHRHVALKVLTRLSAASPAVLQRFTREAVAASKLDHPGICTVYDTGIADGLPYIAMRYVEGGTLAQWIAGAARQGSGVSTAWEVSGQSATADAARTEVVPQSSGSASTLVQPTACGLPTGAEHIRRVVRIIERAARALHFAHEQGVVHRDVKPGNIIVSSDDQPVLLDFGLAGDVDSEGETLTRTGDVFGTPAYMSPEQMRGQTALIDRRTDVWSLGVALYECLALVRPFEAPTRELLYQAVMTRDPADVRRRCPEASDDLWVVVQTALEKEPDRRYRTAAALADDLRAVLDSRPISVRPISAFGRIRRWARREPAKAALLLVLVVAVPLLASLATYSIATRADVRLAEEAHRRERVEEELVDGFFHLEEGAAATGRAAFERALELEPRNIEALAGLLLCIRRIHGDAPFLEAVTGRNWRQVGEFALDSMIIESLDNQGRHDEAQALRASTKVSDHPIGQFITGVSLMAAGHEGDESAYEKARDNFVMAVWGSEHARPLFQYGVAHAAGHLHDVALARWVTASIRRLWPGALVGLYWTGFALATVDAEASLQAYRQVLARDPNMVSARFALGGYFADRGDNAAAEREYREALKIDPNCVELHEAISQLAFVRGATEEAEREAREALRLNPFRSKSYERLAAVLQESGKTAECEALVEKAVELRPGNATAWTKVGVERQIRGDLDGALAAQLRARKLAPKDARILVNLAQVYNAQGDADAELATLDRAVALAPNLANARYNRARILSQFGREEEAIEEVRAVTVIEPGMGSAWCNAGHFLRDLGRYGEALAAMRRGHEVGSASPGWKYPSDGWVAALEKLQVVERRFDSIADGSSEPADALEAWRDVRIAFGRKRFVLAVRLADAAIALRGAAGVDPLGGSRLMAARAAAGWRLGSDWTTLDAAGRQSLLEKARAWITADVVALERGLDQMPERDRRLALQWTNEALHAPELEGLRSAALAESRAASASSPTSRPAADDLWGRIARLRDRLRAAK